MMQITVLLLVCLGPWIHTAQSGPAEEFDTSSMYPEDQDVSGDDLEMSGSGSGDGGFAKVPDFSAPLNVTTPPPAIETTEVPLTTEQAGGVVQAVEETVAPASPTPATSTVGPSRLTTGPRENEALPEVPLLPTTSDSPATTRAVATPPPVKATSAPPATEAVPVETTQALLTTPSSPTTDAVPVIVDVDIEASAEAPTETTTVAEEEEEEEQETPAPTEKTNLLPATTPAAEAELADFTQDDMVSGDGDFVASTVSPLATESAEPPILMDEEIIVPNSRTFLGEEIPNDSDLTFDAEKALSTSENQSLLERKEVLGGVIAGGIVGLAFAIMLVSLMVYRMKKKDEGSYALDEQKHPNGGYQKAQRQEEFLA